MLPGAANGSDMVVVSVAVIVITNRLGRTKKMQRSQLLKPCKKKQENIHFQRRVYLRQQSNQYWSKIDYYLLIIQ